MGCILVHRRIRLGRWRAFILRGGVTLINGENPLFPSLSRTNSVNAVLADLVLHIAKLTGDMAEKLEILRQSLDPLEASNKAQENETLRVHVFPEEDILAKVVHGEVVLKLHRDHAHKRKRFHVWLVRDRSHRTRMHRGISIHSVNVSRNRIGAVHSGRVG